MFVGMNIRTILIGVCLLNSFTATAGRVRDPALLARICADVRDELAQGDLLFIEKTSAIFDIITKTQNHWASHVGIAFKKNTDDWYVVESTIPKSRITPLCDYVRKGIETRVGIKRLHGGIESDEVEDLKESAESKLGVPYNLGFKFDAKKQFCSKLVYQSFMEALGVEIGRKQSFRDMLDETEYPEVMGFWRTWFWGFIPWGRVTVTPGTQYQDNDLDTVLEWKNPDPKLAQLE